MQKIIIDQPYVPVPVHRGKFWPEVFGFVLPWFLRRSYGVTRFKYEHAERLEASLRAGHGILLAPNHCRDEDSFVMGMLSNVVRQRFYFMGSWHVFKQNPATAFLLNRAGVYSVNREGPDRASVKTSVEILEAAERPLVIFPEGYLARTNDRLNALMEGTALIARTAAKRRAQRSPAGLVVVHPIALRYHFEGDFEATVGAMLEDIEKRLTWRPNSSLPALDRVIKVASALLTLKEIEHLGGARPGPLPERIPHLINAILTPLENEWAESAHDGVVQARVRRLRIAILPGLVSGNLADSERQRRWRQLADIYLAQQIDNYPPDYLAGQPSKERILETIERLEEDLTDKIRPHGPFTATLTIGEAITVNPRREHHGTQDPLLQEIERQLRSMLGLSPAAQLPAATPAAISATA